MVAPLKTLGLLELNSLLRRIRRLHALERINDGDAKYLEARLSEVRKRIETMQEKGEEETNG